MIVRLLSRGMLITGEGIPTILSNAPSRRDAYGEFRRRVLHLGELDVQQKLHIGHFTYEDAFPVSLEKGMTPAEVVAAIDRGYRWVMPGLDQPSVLLRRMTSRLVIVNYDLTQLSNEDRKQLNEELERRPADHIYVDIRPGFPGGQYPFKGFILLRSFNAILYSVAQEMAEDPGLHVEPDPRTGVVRANPIHVLKVEESGSPPADAEFAVEFEGAYYSIRKYPTTESPPTSWNQTAFVVLANLFQMTVTDVTNVQTPIISISKG